MSDYTPSTEEVRNEYIDTANPSWLDEEIGRGFDRWLRAVKAEAWDEGYGPDEECHTPRSNPYRKEQETSCES